MYPSGQWRGFWQQEGFGRQPMEEFTIAFKGRQIRGHGRDIVGTFTIRGECEPATGAIAMIKHYLGRHTVRYQGAPDGEGSILGTWTIEGMLGEQSGPFLIQPAMPLDVGSLPIRELGR